MDLYVIALRLIHIFAGAYWVGAGFMMLGVIGPTAQAAGAEGGRFMQRITTQSRYGLFMAIAGLLTTLSGLLLYWRGSGHLQPAWITSGTGLSLTVGGLAGIVAFVLGLAVHWRIGARVKTVTEAMQRAGGPPTPDQLAELQLLGRQEAQAGVWSAVLLTVAVIGMSVAQYLR
jgi:hypothetical protein